MTPEQARELIRITEELLDACYDPVAEAEFLAGFGRWHTLTQRDTPLSEPEGQPKD